MATLILYIPYKRGAILISDRQSTQPNGTIEVWNKIYHLINYNAGIGFAGSSVASRMIAQNLKNSTNESFFDQYGCAYRELHKLGLTADEKNIVSLCIIKKDSSLEVYKITRDIPNLIFEKKPVGIVAVN